ncbi:DUF924 family protein [Caulobacter endophyticus]|uniref:DUF924 family protein n=1 Tax=Caulobacter endophyticus TaxID=2172652 RepID=UPI00240FAFC3|nr:DUF924 family protein [Caulobacter endophyticus]MDG2529656.1 DUF924 family protein [Caulobacter endophyticus]
MAARPQDILGFWTQAGPKQWFDKNRAFDEAIRLKYEPTHHAAARGDYDSWVETPEGSLALVIVLDQFPRNLYRRSGHAFATDGKARAVARAAIAQGHDTAVAPELRYFFYLPFEHSESLADQELCIELCAGMQADTGDEDAIKWAIIHRDIIARFGRFPHRNIALGRETTPAEQAFLDEGGFAG